VQKYLGSRASGQVYKAVGGDALKMGGPRQLKIDRLADIFVGKVAQMCRDIYATPDTYGSDLKKRGAIFALQKLEGS